MKIWVLVCILGFMGDLNAHNIDATESSENREKKHGIGVSFHLDEDPHKENSLKDQPDPFREKSENLSSSKEEIEKPESYLIITTDKLSPPGGGVPSLDPNVVNEMILPPFPEVEAPWWERWWEGVTTWFFGESS